MKYSKFRQINYLFQSNHSTRLNLDTSPIIEYQSKNRLPKYNKKLNPTQNKQNSTASDTLIHCFHPQKLNGNVHSTKSTDNNIQSGNCNNNISNNNNKKLFHFGSNKIAILKNKQTNGQLIEALVNQTIDFNVLPNSTMFGKSIFDCSPTYHCKKNSERVHKTNTMQPVYLTISDKYKSERITTTESHIHLRESNVGLQYSGDIKRIANDAKCAITQSSSDPNNNTKKKDSDKKRIKSKEIERSRDKKMKYNDDGIKKKKALLNTATVKLNSKEEEFNDSYMSNKMNENNEDRLLNYQKNIYRIGLSSHLKSNNDNPSDKTEIEFAPVLRVETNLNIPQSNSQSKEKEIDVTYPNEIVKNDIKKNNLITTDSELIVNKINCKGEGEEDERIETISDAILKENIKTKHVYCSEPIYTLNDIWYKNNANKDKVTLQFNAFIKKYMLDHSLDSSKSLSNDSLTDSRTIQINKDFDEITKLKSQILNIHQYYSNQIYKIEYEMKKIEEKKYKMDESLISKASSSSLPLFSKLDKIRLIMEKLDHLDASLSQKERNYKITVKTLLEQLQEASKNSPDPLLNEDLIKEANDFLNDDENLFKLRRMEMNNSVKAKEAIQLPQDNRRPNRSLLTELENFKKEEESYKFEIPQKYQNMQLVKCVKEQAIKGKLVRFYDNSVIDIVDKKKTIKRVSDTFNK